MPFELLLGEDQPRIEHDLKQSPGRLDELDIGMGKRRAEFGRQTGGAGLIVSDDAVLDGNTHTPQA